MSDVLSVPEQAKNQELQPIMELAELTWRQGLSLDEKILLSKERISEWYRHFRGQIYISFSGGKDSTVLLHLVRSIYPLVPAVFVDTGLEYPEVRRFVDTHENVVIVKPKLSFREVLQKYGYPIVSKEVSQKICEARNTKSQFLRQKRLNGVGLKRTGAIPKGTDNGS